MNSDEVVKLLTYLREQIAPEVLRAGAEVTRLNSIANLINILVVAIIALIVSVICYRTSRLLLVVDSDDAYEGHWLRDEDNAQAAVFAICFTFGLVAVCAGVAALLHLTNAWLWIGIFNPELAFVRELLEKIR